MGRRGFTALAGLLAVFGVTASVFYFVSQPKTLRLAVGPLGSEDARMAAGFVQGLNREKSSLRIRLVLTEGSEESAKKLDDGLADLAIVRPDIALPAQGDTALITRRSFPFIITTKATGIGRIADLRGRRIGVARNPAGNMVLLQRVLAQYEVRPERGRDHRADARTRSFPSPGKRIDAFFSINAVGSLHE
jgi:TRAP-type uncharacterized transport system substrate-binding protein